MKRKILWSLFVLYCIIAVYFLFLWNRVPYVGTRTDYIKSYMNLIPFKTISNSFLLAIQESKFLKNGRFGGLICIINLVGNIIVAVPLGILLPSLFNRFNTFTSFIQITLAIVLIVELLQLFFMVGSCDIDDLILNVIGALMGFGIFKTKCFRELRN